MIAFSRLSPTVALTVVLLTPGCGSTFRERPAFPGSVPQAETWTLGSPAPQQDPVDALISVSEKHFATGEAELGLGHLERAKTAFNRSIDVLLEAPQGARADERLRQHFDRLIERISAHEITALASGDGFTEKKYDTASLDELLTLSTFEFDEPPPGLQEAVESDVRSRLYDVPITLNSRVLAYIDLFQGRLRDWIQDGLRRGTKYLPMIQSVFRAEGLPLDLAYVPLIESAFKPNAVSRAKATGVWQFMRATALENGLKQDWYIDERSDPEKSTVAAARYLRTLYGMFDGDWHLALASYNGGPGRVQRALRRSGANDFWKLSQSTAYLPRETREYVPMILAAIVIARNPAQYGFDFEPFDPVSYEKVRVAEAIDLRRVAEWTGTTIDEIQSLNPELRRWTTPVRYPDYELKVPVGTAVLLEERLGVGPPGEMATLKWHTVKRGETLVSVAQTLGVSRANLAEANYLSANARLTAGQKLIIPRAPTLLLASDTNVPAPPVPPPTLATNDVLALPSASATAANVERFAYRVQPGDSLFSIARLFQTTVAALKHWNQLTGNRVVAGDYLTILLPRLPGSES
jgi:membrane-bound lytic murein transglycosylase D